MPVDSLASFADTLREYQLLSAAQSEEITRSLQTQFADARALAKELIGRGWLTPFQVNQILQGRVRDLVLGPYRLLERVGKGGMGQVFKARHLHLQRVVALKVIVKERLTNPQNVERFYREARAAAQLAHPNIVMAYDADQDGGTHYFAMEYVEGTDLARLLGKSGPLPIAMACDYARQVALGLQHAHECGLVHRDIKPSNVIVSARSGPAGGPVVKILDLGLARLLGPLDGTETGRLTQDGAVMGTPDYLAPEQAVDSHRADIRADIYSLGCTLYHLLTGRPPFPEGSLAQKLLWQQQAEPPAIETLRPEVPPKLAAVLRTLMAKRPEDRYQTPAQVAAALVPFCPGSPALPALPQASTVTRQPTPTVLDMPAPPAGTAHPARRWRGALVGAVAAACLLGIVVLVVALSSSMGRPPGSGEQERTREKGQAEAPNRRVNPVDQPPRKDRSDKQAADRNGEKPAVKDVPVPDPKGPLAEIPPLVGHSQGVTSVAFLPGGRKAISCSSAEVILWDMQQGKNLKQMSPWSRALEDLKFQMPAEGEGAKEIPRVKFPTGEEQEQRLRELSPLTSVVVYDKGRRALFGGGNHVLVWDLEKWKPRCSFAAGEHTGSVDCSLAVSADGKLGLHTNPNGVVRRWDLSREKELPAGFVGNPVCVSGDGSRVLAGQRNKNGFANATVGLHLYDGKTRKQIGELFGEHAYAVVCVAISPDGRRGLSAGSGAKEAILWNLDTRKELLRLKGHTGGIKCVAFSTDGRRALTGSEDKTVRLWNVAGGKELGRFTRHTDAVNCVAFSLGGRLALSGSEDQTVGVWVLPEAKK